MPEKTLELEVTIASGMMLPGYGSRQMGGTFILPEGVARELLKLVPGALKLVTPMPMPKPIEKEVNRG